MHYFINMRVLLNMQVLFCVIFGLIAGIAMEDMLHKARYDGQVEIIINLPMQALKEMEF